MSNAAIARPFLAKNGLDNNGNAVINVSIPVAMTDVANKAYVDSLRSTSFNNQTGTTYTTILSDATYSSNSGGILTFNNTLTQICTIPPNSSVNYPIGSTIQVAQLGVGKVTFAAGSGVTINSPGGLKSIGTQYAIVSLIQIAINNWLLVGSLVA